MRAPLFLFALRTFFCIFVANMRIKASHISIALAAMLLGGLAAKADDKHTEHKEDLSSLSYAWKLESVLGLRELAPIDTLPLNYGQRSIPSFVSPAYATTGNLGAQGINMIYSERPAMSDFFFRDGLRHWLPTFETMRFYNTRVPMTLVSFNSAGSRYDSQERLNAIFSGNVNKRLQFGALLDYLYSKGCYENQGDKNLYWGLSSSYMGDRYELQAYYNHYNLLNKENGGITDMLYITDPAELQGGITSIDPKSIPVNLKAAHNRLRGAELFVNNRYKIGYWHEEKEGDSVVAREYIPVSSIIYTLQFNSDTHTFIDTPEDTKKFFENTYLDPNQTHDVTSYWALTNTVGLSLLEGFNKYAKFGLAAYVKHQVRRYDMTADTLDRSTLNLTPFPQGINIAPRTTENLAWVGGQLTKQRGSLLRYKANAQLGLLGPALGDMNIDGEVQTRFPLFKDSLIISGFGRFDNEEAPFLMNNYLSNHFIWKNDFGKRRTVVLGGRLDLGRTDTRIEASATNVQNHIYFTDNGTPTQFSGNVQVLNLSLWQNFHRGIWHWDNRVTYQASTNTDVISLPTLAVYSNAYMTFQVATLSCQLGVDCDYYTSYYSPTYLPAVAAFANQKEMKVGNYPFCNVYANFKLSKTRFYVMYSHFNQGLFGGNRYFSMPYYPLNPARFQFGLSVDFAN